MVKETVRYKLQASHGQRADAHQVTGQVDDQPVSRFREPSARRDAGAPAGLAARNFDRSLVGWEALDASARPTIANKALASLNARLSILLQAAGCEKVPAFSAISSDNFFSILYHSELAPCRALRDTSMVRSPSEKVADQ